MSDLVRRLRLASSNPYGYEQSLSYARLLAEAADEIERLTTAGRSSGNCANCGTSAVECLKSIRAHEDEWDRKPARCCHHCRSVRYHGLTLRQWVEIGKTLR